MNMSEQAKLDADEVLKKAGKGGAKDKKKTWTLLEIYYLWVWATSLVIIVGKDTLNISTIVLRR